MMSYPSTMNTYPRRMENYPMASYPTPQQRPSPQFLATLPSECFSPRPRCPVPWLQARPRWYYDSTSASCNTFQYSCGEGVNNFHSRSHCTQHCTEQPQNQYQLPNQPTYSQPSQPQQPSNPVFPQPNQPQQYTTQMLTASSLPSFLRSNENALVEFYTTWCGACQAFGPKFEQIASNLRYQTSADVHWILTCPPGPREWR